MSIFAVHWPLQVEPERAARKSRTSFVGDVARCRRNGRRKTRAEGTDTVAGPVLRTVPAVRQQSSQGRAVLRTPGLRQDASAEGDCLRLPGELYVHQGRQGTRAAQHVVRRVGSQRARCFLR